MQPGRDKQNTRRGDNKTVSEKEIYISYAERIDKHEHRRNKPRERASEIVKEHIAYEKSNERLGKEHKQPDKKYGQAERRQQLREKFVRPENKSAAYYPDKQKKKYKRQEKRGSAHTCPAGGFSYINQKRPPHTNI